MKNLTVINYIYSEYNERGTKTFLKKFKSILIKANIKGDAISLNAYKERGNGSGHYYNSIELSIGNTQYTLRQGNNDSLAWDEWSDPTQSQKRNFFLAVLEYEIEQLKELLIEEEEN